MMKTYAIGRKNQPVRIHIKTDNVEHVRRQLEGGELFVEVEIAVDGKLSNDGKKVIPFGIIMEVELSKVREMRQGLLSQCDWTMFLDSPLNQNQRDEWIAYRQALRDITAQSITCFEDVVWPERPDA